MYRYFLLIYNIIFICIEAVAFKQEINDNQKSNFQIEAIPHPCLLLTEQQIPNVVKLISSDSTMKKIHEHIIEKSNLLISKPLLPYHFIGKRLKYAPEALERILYLSYSYRMSKNLKYSNRAIQEILNICNYPDWNESHFLDTADITLAIAIGYDWLYDLFTPSERDIIVSSIKNKALTYVLSEKRQPFLGAYNNWNSVCNSGMLLGAIALIDEMPNITSQIIDICTNSNLRALSIYEPDGGYPEGYAYCSYGSTYEILLLDVLKSNYSPLYESLKIKGFLKTGRYLQYMSAPSNMPFNFGDCKSTARSIIPLCWLAECNNDASLLYTLQKDLTTNLNNYLTSLKLPILIIFASRFKNLGNTKPKHKSLSFRGKTPVYIYRSDWDNITDVYLGIKGGSASTTHAHADAGSFIYEYNGVRWAMDLGSQDYYSLEKENINLWDMKQNSDRWNILRMRNDYHNTITINNSRHIVDAFADIIHTFESEDCKGASVDLTSTLGSVKKAHRTITLDSKNYLTIVDSITNSGKDIKLKWMMITPAYAKIIKENIICLEKNHQKLYVIFDSSVAFELFTLENAPLKYYDHPNPGTMRIGFTTNVKPNDNIIFKVKIRPYI